MIFGMWGKRADNSGLSWRLNDAEQGVIISVKEDGRYNDVARELGEKRDEWGDDELKRWIRLVDAGLLDGDVRRGRHLIEVTLAQDEAAMGYGAMLTGASTTNFTGGPHGCAVLTFTWLQAVMVSQRESRLTISS